MNVYMQQMTEWTWGWEYEISYSSMNMQRDREQKFDSDFKSGGEHIL